jgi:hypothetical protein
MKTAVNQQRQNGHQAWLHLRMICEESWNGDTTLCEQRPEVAGIPAATDLYNAVQLLNAQLYPGINVIATPFMQ